MERKYLDVVMDSPVIAAVKDDEGLARCLQESELKVLFILYGNICNLTDIVKCAKDAGKTVFVHIDLIQGLSSKDVAVDFIRQYTQADGIITTKSAMIGRAKEQGLCTILRFFVIDSMALNNVQKQYQLVKPDFIEVLPGIMPKVIKKIVAKIPVPLIASGMIIDKEDVVGALNAGAISVSATCQDVWKM